jgi:hypothetical protein
MSGRAEVRRWATLASVLVATLAPGPARAQSTEEALPPEGALFLLLPISAKAVAVGRAMTALTGAESVWWNPAGLADVKQGSAIVYRGDHPLVGEANAASVVMRASSLGAAGLSYQLMDVGTQDVTDEQGNVVGQITSRNHLGLVSVATRWQDRISVGVNLKVVQSRFGCRGQCQDAGVTTTAYAIDAGVQVMDTTVAPLRVGVTVVNAGTKFGSASESDPLPARLRVAAAYELLGHFLETQDLSLFLTGEVEHRWRAAGTPAFYAGTEFTAGTGDLLMVRAGYIFRSDQQVQRGASVGVGLRYNRFDLGLAKSLAVSSIPGESEPVHISVGFIF